MHICCTLHCMSYVPESMAAKETLLSYCMEIENYSMSRLVVLKRRMKIISIWFYVCVFQLCIMCNCVSVCESGASFLCQVVKYDDLSCKPL
jgi:hypothetical protein